MSDQRRLAINWTHLLLLLGVDMHTMHDYVAALSGVSLQESLERGVMVEGRQDVPGELLIDHLNNGGKGDDMEGYAVAMNVFADNPLACYYGEGATTSSDSSGVIPPEDNFEYQTIEEELSVQQSCQGGKARTFTPLHLLCRGRRCPG